MSKQQWQRVCDLNSLRPGLGVAAELDGAQVALFRLDDSEQVYAIDNHDPYSGANVLSRGLVGDLGGRPVVASPIYKQHFDLTSGECLEDEAVRLKTYAARVVEGAVELATEELEAAA